MEADGYSRRITSKKGGMGAAKIKSAQSPSLGGWKLNSVPSGGLPPNALKKGED